ncbi:MAG: DUF1385 domain-containing protein [Eubacterium sp.]|nr:DUF1385 domain-containing protein [Eubacterium sp.]
MKPSYIGGQAVLEGVMMKNKNTYAVAVRKPDGEITVDVKNVKRGKIVEAVKNIPILRGVVNFVDSLVIGMSTLTYSASFYEEEEEKPVSEKKEKFMMGMTVLFSIVLAVAIFMLLPYGLSLFFGRFTDSVVLLSLIEGIIRLIIFLLYVWGISLMEDIRRVYMYHGAEHKCINCIESGLELNVENVRKSSRMHKRCGTSFLLFVMIVSIIVFSFITAPSPVLRLVLRLLLIPLVAGISYEIIRLAGRSENRIVSLISKPGLCLQHLTTREPEDDMIEVGIASVEAVFDWKKFLEEF